MSCSLGSNRQVARLASWVTCFVALATSAAVARSAAADEPPSQPPARSDRKADDAPRRPSLDDALLKDLDNELLDGAGGAKMRTDKPAGEAAADSDGKRGKKGEANQDQQPAATAAAEGDTDMPAEDADPLVHVSQQMRTVGELIPKPAKRPHAEAVQQRIVEDLVRLIEQAESQRAQQQSSSSKSKKQPSTADRQRVQQPKQQAAGSSGKDSNKPAQDSTDRLGKAEAARPDPELLKGFMKDAWGHLPAHDREQVLQTTREQFLPQYELMIEQYYKRLAEDERAR